MFTSSNALHSSRGVSGTRIMLCRSGLSGLAISSSNKPAPHRAGFFMPAAKGAGQKLIPTPPRFRPHLVGTAFRRDVPERPLHEGWTAPAPRGRQRTPAPLGRPMREGRGPYDPLGKRVFPRTNWKLLGGSRHRGKKRRARNVFGRSLQSWSRGKSHSAPLHFRNLSFPGASPCAYSSTSGTISGSSPMKSSRTDARSSAIRE
jgi:hypothetical protein